MIPRPRPSGTGAALAAAALLAAALAASGAAAQSSACGDVSGPQADRFGISLSPGQVSFPVPGPDEFDVGYVQHPTGLRVTIDPPTGRTWFLCVRTPEPAGANGKPAADLEVWSDYLRRWLPLSSTEQRVATGSGNTPRTLAVPVRLRLRWDRDVPGEYAPFTLVFSAAN